MAGRPTRSVASGGGGGREFQTVGRSSPGGLLRTHQTKPEQKEPKNMQITGFVLEDSEKEWSVDGRSGVSRTIVIIDRDEGESRLLQPLRLRIKESEIAGPTGSLRDSVVRLAITRIEQNERTKDVRIDGHVLEVAGSMRFEERQVKKVNINRGQPGPTATATA